MQIVFKGFSHIMYEVALALLPLFIFFLVFQVLFLRLPLRKILDISIGFILTFLGLALFLQGVEFGFLPIGELMGQKLGMLDQRWILIPIGFVLGFTAIYAEPAVSVLINQVDRVSSGYIPRKVLLYTLSIGVGLSVALAMIRIIFGISLWYFVLPGYIIAFIMIRFSKRAFTSIAFDSGGVATGPMTATFILALFVGIATVTEGRDPLLDGFGMVALVALAPILSVLTLGILYSRKENALHDRDDKRAEANYHDRP